MALLTHENPQTPDVHYQLSRKEIVATTIAAVFLSGYAVLMLPIFGDPDSTNPQPTKAPVEGCYNNSIGSTC